MNPATVNAIDEARMNTAVGMDYAKPPQKPIPFAEFPRVVYKHPKKAFRDIVHRNAKMEVVFTEVVPAEALSKVVADKKELELAMKDGWVKECYVAPALPDDNAGLYSE